MFRVKFFFERDGRRVPVTAYQEDIIESEQGEFIIVNPIDGSKAALIPLEDLRWTHDFIPELAGEITPVTYAGMERTPQN